MNYNLTNYLPTPEGIGMFSGPIHLTSVEFSKKQLTTYESFTYRSVSLSAGESFKEAKHMPEKKKKSINTFKVYIIYIYI